VYSIVPGVSVSGVADVFAFQGDGTVQAITSDGATAWTGDVSQAWPVVPDFQGGLVGIDWSTGTASIVKWDGTTGQRYPAYTPNGESVISDPLGIHPDGTVFAIQRNSDSWPDTVIGIDPTTGTLKFSVPLNISSDAEGPYESGVMIAGDGHAYVPYGYRGQGVTTLSHLKLLRIDTAGAYDDIPIADITTMYSEMFSIPVNMITNADTGILLSWSAWNGYNPVLGMAITNGTGVSLINGSLMPDQSESVVPVLQAQDSSFVGTVWAGSDDSILYMVAFDQTGSLRWSVPNEQPQIATEDGGVIGQSGATYDQNGNITGQLANMPTYSWLGNSYQIGSVDQVVTNWINLAVSWCPFAGGNPSRNGTANMPAAEAVRQLIAQISSYYTNFPQNSTWENKQPENQCNQFVHDVLAEAGTQAPLSLGTKFRNAFPRIAYYMGKTTSASYPASAGDWAYPHNTLTCWQNVTVPTDRLGGYPADVSKPGDVIAEAINYTDASGHVGIIVGPRQTASADSAAACMSKGPSEMIDLTDYGFRADGSVAVNPNTGQVCSTSGWKSNAVVKRFVCQ
jgi:hypothetical protein